MYNRLYISDEGTIESCYLDNLDRIRYELEICKPVLGLRISFRDATRWIGFFRLLHEAKNITKVTMDTTHWSVLKTEEKLALLSSHFCLEFQYWDVSTICVAPSPLLDARNGLMVKQNRAAKTLYLLWAGNDSGILSLLSWELIDRINKFVKQWSHSTYKEWKEQLEEESLV